MRVYLCDRRAQGFKLITHLPEAIPRWVGQMIQNLGEEGYEQRTRAMFTGAVARVEIVAGAAFNSKSKPKPDPLEKKALEGDLSGGDSGW